MWNLLLICVGLYFLWIIPEIINQVGGGDSLANC